MCPISPRSRADSIGRFPGRAARAARECVCPLLFAACTATLVMVSGIGCRPARSTPGGGSVPGEDLRVHRGTFLRRVLLTGELKAARAAKISAPLTEQGQVQIRWLERDGTRVEKGQRVVEFDSSPFAAGLEEKRLAVVSALREEEQEEAQGEANRAEKELALEKARIALEKAKIDAAVPEELVSQRDFQERQLKLEKARVEVEKATEQLDATHQASLAALAVRRIARESAQRDVRVAEDAIARLTVAAPRDGIFQVAEHPWEGRKFQAGDAVWPSFGIAFIPEPSSLMVEASLVDVDDGTVSVGMPVVCTLDAYPERSYPGRVAGISPVAQEPARGSRRRAFRVEVALDSVDEARMRVGMSVKVEVEAERRAGVLLAWRGALDLSGRTARARLATGGVADVRLGPCSAQECVVLAGLPEGTQLAAIRRSAP
jgi:multidrug resistance efflux pump